MENSRVLCCGLVCADFFNICEKYPVEDSDEEIVRQYWQRGGNASNMCTVLALLGVDAEFFGCIPAESPHRKFLETDFTNRGIHYEHCVYYDMEGCAQATIICNLKTGSRTILHTNCHLPQLTFLDFRNRIELRRYRWIHFEGRRTVDEIAAMLLHVEQYNSENPTEKRIVTSVELEKRRDGLDLLRDKADYVFVGKDHAIYKGYHDPIAACQGFSSFIKHGSAVIVPWGEKGACALYRDGEVIEARARTPVKVVDSTGAGDTFVAATIYALSSGQCLSGAINFGCEVAGNKIGDFGFDHVRSCANRLQ